MLELWMFSTKRSNFQLFVLNASPNVTVGTYIFVVLRPKFYEWFADHLKDSPELKMVELLNVDKANICYTKHECCKSVIVLLLLANINIFCSKVRSPSVSSKTKVSSLSLDFKIRILTPFVVRAAVTAKSRLYMLFNSDDFRNFNPIISYNDFSL